MHGAPLYIAETCPSQIRGTLISLKELFIVLGILVWYFFQDCASYILQSICAQELNNAFSAAGLFCW